MKELMEELRKQTVFFSKYLWSINVLALSIWKKNCLVTFDFFNICIFHPNSDNLAVGAGCRFT